MRAVFFRILIGIVLGIALSVVLMRIVGAAELAAPYDPSPNPTCRDGAFIQHDLAGTYENQNMLVEVYPCGGVILNWINDWGEHHAVYFSVDRIHTGGVFMVGYVPDGEINAYLDGEPYAALTPAEPGWVRFRSISKEGQIVRTYRLQKTL